MLNLLRKSAARKQMARALYDDLVIRARAPIFFRDFGIPDTLDGRFDLMTLHAWLALTRLQEAGLEQLAQDLTDAIFAGFDEALREQGAGDMSLGHKMKAMAKAFYGRLAAYEGAADEGALATALARNLWRGAETDGRSRALALYVRNARQALELSVMEHGKLDFGDLPSL